MSLIGHHFTGTDRREGSISSGVDAVAYKTHAAITHGELAAACVTAGERIVVGPVADVLGYLQHAVQRNCSRRCHCVGIVPPVPLAPARHGFADDVSVRRAVDDVAHARWRVHVGLIGTDHTVP